MKGFEESTEMGENVVAFPTKSIDQVGFKTQEDPDDLISALLNEFSFEDNPETLDEVLDKIETPSLNEQEVSFLMDEELELSQCLDRCDELLRKLESRVKRISYYVGELDKTI